MNTILINDKKHKWIASYYFIFSILGLYSLTNMLLTGSLSWFILILYLILYFQLIMMLLGAIWYWHSKLQGAKILYWVSLSLIPIIITPFMIYIPKWTIGLTLFGQVAPFHTNFGFDFFISQEITFKFLAYNVWGFGLNIIEYILFQRFRGVIQEAKDQNLSIYAPKDSEKPES